jgi:hypothetical protein
MTTIYSAADLATAVSDLRPDAATAGLPITFEWCRAQMHDLGITRYEDVDLDTLHAIADRGDWLADDLTDEQIGALQTEAADADDRVTYDLCDLALAGDMPARFRVLDIITSARGMKD